MPREVASAHRLIGPAITDVAGEPAGSTQVERLIARYHWTAGYCKDRDVLEVACGTGQGLGLLDKSARKLFACDLSAENLERVRSTYGKNIPLVQTDAQLLPFGDESLDVVVLLETLYFLPSAHAFLAEAKRVLRPGGHCLISAINKDCPDFNPNHPLYFAHYGAAELAGKMERHGLVPECFGIIPMDTPSLRSRLLRPIKRLAIKLNLIPDSMQARLILKRIVFGKLNEMPHDIASLPVPETIPVTISARHPDLVHQVVLCAGRRA